MDIITLRKYELSDVDDFMEWACNAEVLNYSYLIDWIDPNSTREQVEKYSQEAIIPHPWFRAVCLNGKPVGFLSIQPKTEKWETGTGVFSGALGRKYWSKGLMTTAGRMALEAAFRELPHLLRIECYTDVTNYGVHKALQKAGFLKEGLLRKYYSLNGIGSDYFVHSILSTDPIPKSAL